ncbi:hypothetical protein RA307_10250 [Xanthobacteraceae bacterium Astr-EGSB]|uniref:hypothetical protein n=1 Tax=Astrobacterium formosum TaxID=3069710 RepID=UPI0027ADC7FE|nr:hypothetical protein [Xanthobacteraceae bacterium Astr-EGSB]
MALARRLAAFVLSGRRLRYRSFPRQELVTFGGVPAGSIDEVARVASTIMLAVFDTDQVEQVVENEILPAAGEVSDRVILCASTCESLRIAALADRVARPSLRRDAGVRLIRPGRQ